MLITPAPVGVTAMTENDTRQIIIAYTAIVVAWSMPAFSRSLSGGLS
jgi:hypothetical protein